MAIIAVVVEQHAEEAAFLWLLRDAAVRAPHYLLWELAKVDDRVEAQLDGLRIAGDAGWDLCKKAAADGGPGEVFAGAILALESGKADRIDFVVEHGCSKPAKARGLISAFGWLPYERVKEHIVSLATSFRFPLRRVGLAAAAAHRQHPPFSLSSAFRANDPLFKVRALKAVGEFGATDVLTSLKHYLDADDPRCSFWAAWSGVLVYGDPTAQVALQGITEGGGPFAERAAQLACRRLDLPLANRWRQRLAELGNKRCSIRVAGAVGDPEAVPFLIEQMRVPPLARIAGEAFALLTGVDIAYNDLEGKKPEGFEAGPTENAADDNVELDPDDNLAWPDADLVAKWWQAHQTGFGKGKRYLLGKLLGPEALADALRNGRQRQRAAAALELALKKRGQPLFEVRAPGFRQQEALAQNT
jgi:uncharacterized protein (TIGR02270 family)